METEVVDSEQLKFFTPFHSLSNAQLDYIAFNAQVVRLGAGETILELNSNTNDKYLLLEGSVKLLSTDNAICIIKAHTERAKNPIAQLRPSRYKVSAYSHSKVLILKEDFIETAAEQVEVASSYSINETILDEEHEEDRILYELILELQQGNFILPSLSHVAAHIRETITQERVSVASLANVILADPAIAAKIMEVANRELNQIKTAVEDCKSAIGSLGIKTTTSLLDSYTLNEIFVSSDKMLQSRMHQFWDHSIEIAAISFVLAQVTPGFDAEHALLAGLLHDIGNVAILNKATEHPLITDSGEHLDKIIYKMHTQVSTSILTRWNFPESFIAVAEETEDWYRDSNDKPDMVDIVNMAHLHSYIGSPKQKSIPFIDQVPAFRKMALGKLTPKLSLKILEKAHEKVAQIKSFLNL